jgi:hypothetical protein
MCSGRHHLFIITVVSLNKNGKGIVFIHIRYNILRLRDFLTLPTGLVHKIRAQYSAYCQYAFIALYCEFICI